MRILGILLALTTAVCAAPDQPFMGVWAAPDGTQYFVEVQSEALLSSEKLPSHDAVCAFARKIALEISRNDFGPAQYLVVRAGNFRVMCVIALSTSL